MKKSRRMKKAAGNSPYRDSQPLKALLQDLGYGHPRAEKAARNVLYERKLTRPGKENISAMKVKQLPELLESKLLLVCDHPDCQAEASYDSARELLPVTSARDCGICVSSDNSRAVRMLVRKLKERNDTRVVIVGGGLRMQQELKKLVGKALTIKFVNGTAPPKPKRAASHLKWADVVVVLTDSPLNHKVGNLYTRTSSPVRGRVMRVNERGIAATARSIVGMIEHR